MTDISTLMDRMDAMMDEYCQETGKTRQEVALEFVQAVGLKMSAALAEIKPEAAAADDADPVAETSAA